jgi:hypothetical protein
VERIEALYPQLAAVQDAYQLTAGGRTAVAEAYAAFREFHGPLITSIAAQMLPDLRRDAAAGRHVVFVGRDGHSFAAATRALDPHFFDARCHEVVLSRVVAEAALQDLEVHRGARFPEVEGFRGTRNRVGPQDVPGAFRRLTAYLRTAGIPVGRPGSAVTLVDSSFKGTVQELLTAAYPHTDFQGRSGVMGAGAAWQLLYSRLPRRPDLIAYVSSVADGSGNNDTCEPDDRSVPLTAEAVENWSATRWIARLAHEYGLPVSGEKAREEQVREEWR